MKKFAIAMTFPFQDDSPSLEIVEAENVYDVLKKAKIIGYNMYHDTKEIIDGLIEREPSLEEIYEELGEIEHYIKIAEI